MDEHQFGGGRITAAAAGPSPLAWHRQPPPAPAPSPTYAGFWRRFLASEIDGFVVGFVSYPLSFVLDLILGRVVEAGDSVGDQLRALVVGYAAYMTLFIVLNWPYCAVLESSSWQVTLGKRALGMAVTDLTGHRISFGRATGRFFAHFVSGILLGLGYLMQPFAAKRQALHDIIAGTLVVRT